MAEHDQDSVAGLIRSVLDDTRELIREEIALARAEIREEIGAARSVGVSFGGAADAALLGATLLCITIGGAIAYFLDWPAWAGYGITALLLLGGAYALVSYGRRQLANVRALPKTTDSLKENMAWIQSRSAEK